MAEPRENPPPTTSGDDPAVASPPRLNKRQIQAAETRERMVVAAREVFETKGYRAASVALITKQADTAHGTFYLYFKNKDEAFVEVIGSIGDEMRQLSRNRLAGDRQETLEGVLRAFFEVFANSAPLWRALLEGMLQSPAIEELYDATSSWFIDRIATQLQREQDAGRMRPLDAHEAATALASMVEWLAFRRLASGDRKTPATLDEIDALVETVTDLWLAALYGSVDLSTLR